ncbi:acetyl esterase/lipase [Lachnospiraceae bacterium PF1-21]|uniref:alpha/beta hydrolase n=1 Tax=Ohessyouella blattaphilus TaxID=2949333 RepID=UPI003E244790
MTNNKYTIWEEGEYTYPEAFGFVPNIRSYLHDDEQLRPGMIVVPGGGYGFVSPTEGEIVAKEFFDKGFNTFVLTYTINMLQITPLKRQAMQDLSRAIRFVRRHAKEFKVDSTRLTICGFSAGGHLCGSVCVHYEDITDTNEKYQDISNRPSGALLCYPVILMNEKGHEGSRLNLLGAEATEEEIDYMSLDKHVDVSTPPCFIWQTADDAAVPSDNSFAYAKACQESGIHFAYHLFSRGEHGLSLANEVWAAGEYGTPYTMEQTLNTIGEIKKGSISLPEDMKEELLQRFEVGGQRGDNKPNEEVAVWPELASEWLRKTGLFITSD